MKRIRSWSGLALLLASAAAGGCGDDATTPEVMEDPPTWEPYEFVVGSDEYLDNRFFLLDLSDGIHEAPYRDSPGRPYYYPIDIESICVYESVLGVAAEPPLAIAAFLDTTGVFWSTPESPEQDFLHPYFEAENWRPVEGIEFLLDSAGDLVAIDLGSERDEQSVLAVSYRAVRGTGDEIRVGDCPGRDDPPYRMKLLKAAGTDREPYSFRYELRSIYDIGGRNIDADHFGMDIERRDPASTHPELDENGIPYIRIFGLDRYGVVDGSPDGEVDFYNDFLVDLRNGLLKFPLDCLSPFAGTRELYEAHADDESFTWEGTFLADHLAPELYDPAVLPAERADYGFFTLRFRSIRAISETLESVSLKRMDWHLASLPLGEIPGGGERLPEQRAESIRWFLPRERVTAHDLSPGLIGDARDLEITALNLFLWDEDGAWEAGEWGGVMQGLSRIGLDVTGAEAFEFWVNDAEVDSTLRSGTLHFDFGRIEEDFFWPVDGSGELVVGEWEREDGILPDMDADGVWTQEEDIGLNGDEWSWQRYDSSYDYAGDVDYPGPSHPYPGLNGTARNNREDNEDINQNWALDIKNSYLSASIDLRDAAFRDVLRDCTDPDDYAQFVAEGKAWRQYRIPLEEFEAFTDDPEPAAESITHCRIWYENPGLQQSAVQLQFAAIRFVSSASR